jgi:hypothetical protein
MHYGSKVQAFLVQKVEQNATLSIRTMCMFFKGNGLIEFAPTFVADIELSIFSARAKARGFLPLFDSANTPLWSAPVNVFG